MEHVLIVFGVALFIILVCREITCWYLKINASLAVLEEVRDLLKAQAASNPPPARPR